MHLAQAERDPPPAFVRRKTPGKIKGCVPAGPPMFALNFVNEIVSLI